MGSLRDFQSLEIDLVQQKIHHHLPRRDYGHKANILNSYFSTHGESLRYTALTASFFFAFKQALDAGTSVTVNSQY